jgi:hypothetical protein
MVTGMSAAALEPHRWSAQIEDDIYRDVVTRFAPFAAATRGAGACCGDAGRDRGHLRQLDLDGRARCWIVQAASKALDRLFPDLTSSISWRARSAMTGSTQSSCVTM